MINQYTQRYTQFGKDYIIECKQSLEGKGLSELQKMRQYLLQKSQRQEVLKEEFERILTEAENNLYPNMPELTKVLRQIMFKYYEL